MSFMSQAFHISNQNIYIYLKNSLISYTLLLLIKEMATSRLARFVSEVAPPQFVTVMRRHRATKQKLDTIKEEENKEDCFNGGMMMMMKTSSHHVYSASSSSSTTLVSVSESSSSKFFRSSFSVFEN